MAKKGYVTWHDYENHRAMNLMGGAALFVGSVYLVMGFYNLHGRSVAGGLLLFLGGCFGVPRLRRWVTRGRLSNVSVWDRIIGRTLFMLLSAIGYLYFIYQ